LLSSSSRCSRHCCGCCCSVVSRPVTAYPPRRPSARHSQQVARGADVVPTRHRSHSTQQLRGTHDPC
jgi:hypothetical protein